MKNAKDTVENKEQVENRSESSQGESLIPVTLRLAEAIRQSHLCQSKATNDLVYATIQTGLLLKLAKCLVDHGDFETWCEDQRFGFTRMTRSKYMRLADEFCDRAKCKPDLLLTVQLGPDRRPCSYSIDTTRLNTLATEICQGRSLVELYEDWLITPIKAKSEEPTQTNAQPWSDAAFKRILNSLNRLESIVDTVPTEKRDQLRLKLESLVTRLTPVT